MKTRVLLFCAVVLFLHGSGHAQDAGLSRIPARTITLSSYRNEKARAKSVFNIEHGVRGNVPSSTIQPRIAELPTPRSSGDLPDFGRDAPDFSTGPLAPDPTVDQRFSRQSDPQVYVRYGALSIRGDGDWLDIVAPPPGALGTIKDMGELSWSEVHEVPVLMFTPHPHGYPVPGHRAVFSNEVVKAKVGHMYVLRVKKQKTDFYTLLRVEAIDPKGECTFTWKRVPPAKK
jgi:hypothetical protein